MSLACSFPGSLLRVNVQALFKTLTPSISFHRTDWEEARTVEVGIFFTFLQGDSGKNVLNLAQKLSAQTLLFLLRDTWTSFYANINFHLAGSCHPGVPLSF